MVWFNMVHAMSLYREAGGAAAAEHFIRPHASNDIEKTFLVRARRIQFSIIHSKR